MDAFGGRYPIRYLQMELTSRCNLRCVECPHRMMRRPAQDMRAEVLEAVIEKILRPHPIAGLIPSLSGEPFLHRQFQAFMQRIASVYRGSVELFTNGTRYTREHHRFLASLPNYTRVLMTHHLYDAEGRKVDYALPSAVLLACLEEPVPNVEYILTTHATRHAPDAELERWQSHWREAQAKHPRLTAVHVNPHIMTWAGKVEGNTPYPYCAYANEGTHLFVGCTGNVLPCCIDMEEDLRLGNLLTDPMDAIMRTREAFYDALRQRGSLAPLCQNCLTKETT